MKPTRIDNDEMKQPDLLDEIEVVLDYEDAGINLANGDHHGIGYLKGQLVLFKSSDRHSLVSRSITIAQGLEWMEAMHVAHDHSEPGSFSSSSADLAGQLHWYRDLKAALTKV